MTRLALFTIAALALLAPPALSHSADVTMETQLENTHVLPGGHTLHALVSIKAAESNADRSVPVNLALVIDRSGSMAGKKIADARAAAIAMVDSLRVGDRVAIISYANSARVDIPSRQITKRNREAIKDTIRRLSQGGATHLSGGLEAGHRQVRPFLGGERATRVILISDGQANRGVTAPPELNRIAREAQQSGIVTSTLGLGADYNEDLMTALADHGGGNYYFVERSTELAGVLDGELRQMMSTLGRRASLELTPPKGVRVEDVIGYAFKREGRTIIVPLGDLFSGQERALLWRLQTPNALGEATLGEMVLSYEDTKAKARRQGVRAPLHVTVTRDRALIQAQRNKEVEARIAEIELATSMSKAATLVERGEYEDAKETLKRARDKAQKRASALGGAVGAELQGSVNSAQGLLDTMRVAPASPKAKRAMVKRQKASAYRLRKK